MAQTKWLFHTSCHMRHSPNFDKIVSFLKSVLNIYILGNLIVGWGERIIKEGVGNLPQIYRLSGDVDIWGSGIHRIKDWYYLEPSQISKVEFFAAMNSFCKKLQFKCLTGFTRRCQKHFQVLLVKILHFEKKLVISTPARLSLLFQEKMWLIKKGVG